MEAKPQRSNRIGYSYGGTAQLTSGSTAAPLTSLIHEFFTVLAFSGGDWYEGEFLKWMRHGKVCRRCGQLAVLYDRSALRLDAGNWPISVWLIKRTAYAKLRKVGTAGPPTGL